VQRRTRVVTVATLVVALVATAVTVTLLSQREPEPPPVTAAQARAAAAKACADVTAFERLVERNASITDVKAVLSRAEQEAATAARGDASWYGLSGGLKTLRIALDADDERVARTGINVVRTECRRLAP
jgi:hypothetical protein